jgi:hypothetical protein
MPLTELSEHPFDTIRLPSEPSAEALRAWILKVTEYLGISPTELARQAQVAPSTVNKFVADATASRGLTAKTMEKLFQAAAEIHNNKFGVARFQSVKEPDPKLDPSGFTVVHVRVATALRRGFFKKSHLWPVEQQFFVSVMMPNLLRTGKGREESILPNGLVGMVVADHHAERTFEKSTILIVKPFDPETESPQPGEQFVVSRTDPEGKIELSVRQFMVSPSGDMWLLSQSAIERVPDVHLGRVEFEIKYEEQQDFRITQEADYRLEFKVILELKPHTIEFEALTFPQ